MTKNAFDDAHAQPVFRALTIRSLILLVVTVIALLPTACSRQKESPPEVIAAHSEGVISATDPIRVRFARDVASVESLGAEVSPSPVRLRPKVEGIARWTAPDVLTFEPASPLRGGEHYEVRVDLAAIIEDREDTFSFDLEVMEQSLEISIAGLETTDESDELRLQGMLQTADIADSGAVERTLSATLDGTKLPLTWAHGSDGRRHDFTVEAVTRNEQDQSIRLEWDGSPIGAHSKGKQEINVVRRGLFVITGARAVHQGNKYIEIRCSGNVDAEQDLLGLIEIGGHEDLRFEISGNVITVFATGGWEDEEELLIDRGLRSEGGQQLGTPFEQTLHFRPPLPSVKFASKGVIIPSTNGLNLPIEVTALRAIEIEASQVFEDNLPQFFQVNSISETDELRRVGRVIWKQRIVLDDDGSLGESRRFGLDLSPLVTQSPGGLYHLKIRFTRSDIDFECSDAVDFPTPVPEDASWDEEESSLWDLWGDSSEFSWSDLFENRNDPCHPGFYMPYHDHNIEIEQNVLLSNLGLIAKAGEGDGVFVLVTDLRTAKPLAGIGVTLLDYQQQVMTSGTTGAEGMFRFDASDDPFLIVAQSGDQVGYLKMDDGQALSMSRFDIAGAKITQGLKGFIYAERGVWRPGDRMHLGFILHDPEGRIPSDHPVVFELRNPQDQLVRRETQKATEGQFFIFEPQTDADAPTGEYRVTVRLGGTTFEKALKVAMVRPNRLRIALESDAPEIRAPESRLKGLLEASWLHGAEAGGLEARIDARLVSMTTEFKERPDFVFDDPTRSVDSEEITIMDGHLDQHGRIRLNNEIPVEAAAPGKLAAILTTRVFERGGAFSINETTMPVSPYEHYVGLRTKPGDATRGMLLTDTDHRIDLALLDQEGRPVEGEVNVSLHKISWRWWWEKGGDEGLVDFAQSSSLQPIISETVHLVGGEGSWNFSIAYPEWGRFLLLAEDPEGGHRTGKVIYIDWPGWAGKARKGAGDSAEVLSLSSDQENYVVGDEVQISIPSAAPGKILVSLEKGTTILRTDLIDAQAERTPYHFTVTEEMTPNIYLVISFIQPHEHPGNDLPIRMYGVLPINVNNPDSRLEPLIEAPKSFKPETTGKISVSEANGRAMSYTVAVVDEGLLGLTGFVTPDPWATFYRREALGVRTWDLYNDVVGAWGSALQSLLAVGGGESGKIKPGSKKERRFPPMVRFLGPFHLDAGKTATHKIDVPLYVGSVRVMVVAAEGPAFGRAGKDVPVRKKLMVLGSLPRLLAPGESLQWPISVFVMEGGPSKVRLTAETQGPVTIDGQSSQNLEFSGPGEQLATFPITVGEGEGPAKFTIQAKGGGENSRHVINLNVRRPARPVTTVKRHRMSPGAPWHTAVALPENKTDRHLRLEVSRVPPMDLGRRLDQLIHYPYGCLEQTVSAAFPQLYLGRIVTLGPDREAEVEKNISAALERLRKFQLPAGGMSLWPVASGGFWASAPRYEVDPWVTTYAGHFLLEAKRAGYRVPGEVLQHWETYQRKTARLFTSDTDADIVLQAYRLQTLALGGAPELGAMNRLRETPRLPAIARWELAAAYALAGRPEAGQALVADAPMMFQPYRELGGNYGSEVRDQAIVLEALRALDRQEGAADMVEKLSSALSSDRPLSTQSTAFALMAIARNIGKTDTRWTFDVTQEGEKTVHVEAVKAVVERDLSPLSGNLTVINTSEETLYAALFIRGIPARDEEKAASQGLILKTFFEDGDGENIDPTQLDQGMDFRYIVELSNPEDGRRLENLALSIPVAEGWEIRSIETEGILDHQDVRDARVDLFFDLAAGQTLSTGISITAAFKGRFYLPMVTAEAMYDPSVAARVPGRWVAVEGP